MSSFDFNKKVEKQSQIEIFYNLSFVTVFNLWDMCRAAKFPTILKFLINSIILTQL
jgi:hypothetical protein